MQSNSADYMDKIRNQLAANEDMNTENAQDNQNKKFQLEIKNGVPTRSLNHLNKNQNALVLNTYNGFEGFLTFLYDTLVAFDHAILLLHFIVIQIAGSHDDYTFVFFVAGMSIFGNGVINLVHDKNKKTSAEQVNKKQVDKFMFTKRNKHYQSSDWGSIQTGEILKIKSGQEVPCDCLILDIVGSKGAVQTCYSSSGLFDDPGLPTLKRSYQGTMNRTGNYISDSKFVDQISGLIKWEYNNSGYFKGDFKQIDNPAAFEIQTCNVVHRGAFISNMEYAVCMALNVGQNTMSNAFPTPELVQVRIKRLLMNRGKLSRPINIVYRTMRQIQIIAILAGLIPVIFQILQDFALKQINAGKFDQFLHRQDHGHDDYKNIIQMFEVYSKFLYNVPYLTFACFEAIIYFHAYFVLWDVNLVPAGVNFSNLRAMQGLSQVDTLICSKNCLVNSKMRYVAAFQVGETVYHNKLNMITNEYNNIRLEDNSDTDDSSRSSDDEDNTREFIDYLPNYVRPIQRFQNDTATTLLQEKHVNNQDFKEFLLALTLNHSAVAMKNQQNNDQNSFLNFFAQNNQQRYKSYYKDEEICLQFAEQYGYQFKMKLNKMISINVNQSPLRFEEISQGYIRYQNLTMSVQIVKPFLNLNQQAKIYFSGPLMLMQNMLDKYYTVNLDNEIDKFCKDGIHAIGVASKDIDIETAHEIGRMLDQNNSLGKAEAENRNDSIRFNLAFDLKLLGIIGVKSITKIRDSLIVDDLKKNGIKLYFLCSDNPLENITDFNCLKLFQDCKQPINILGKTDRQVEQSLKTCLKQVIDRRCNEEQGTNTNGPETTNSRVASSNYYTTKRRGNTTTTSTTRTGTSKSEIEFEKRSDLLEIEEKNAVFVTGKQLNFILKDETLTKLFFTLCNLSALLIGSNITVMQKKQFTLAAKKFAIQGNLGQIMTLISRQNDKFTAMDADITVTLKRKDQSADILACSDIQINDIYALSYMMFKHGSILHKRILMTFSEFVYRTLVLFCLQMVFFVIAGFSAITPFQPLYFAAQVALISPIQFFIEGILNQFYGIFVYHRIYGQYRTNRLQQFKFSNTKCPLISALIDTVILSTLYICWSQNSGDLLTTVDGKIITWDCMQVVNSVLLSIFIYSRDFNIQSSPKMLYLLNFICLLISLFFILDEENLTSFSYILTSPNIIGTFIWVILIIFVKKYLLLIKNLGFTQESSIFRFYKEVEDYLYLEEFEDPDQRFEIKSQANYDVILKDIEDNKLFCINQNLLKTTRSDSIDAILERINYTSGQSLEGNQSLTNRATINKFNLKLQDINKEIEYNQNSLSEVYLLNQLQYIWAVVILQTLMGIYRIINYFIFDYSSAVKASVAIQGNQVAPPPNSKMLEMASKRVSMIYLEIITVIILVASIYLIKKLRMVRSDLIFYFLILYLNMIVNIKILMDGDNHLTQIEFLVVISFSHLVRLNSFFYVSLVCFISATIFINIGLQEDYAKAHNTSNLKYWDESALTLYILFWTYYTYWDEILNKVRFVTQFRQVKVLQKLKSIINILIPSLVRQRIQEGKKNFSDACGEVTIIFIDIDGFDQLVQQYTGKELIEFLDKTYNAFDSLCEQHGLQKIETVGKTYMACGGLKVSEKDVDSRLLGSHHAVRVADYALNAQQYCKSQLLRSGKKLQVKIGIHTGEVISGVVGETKPQFSLIGPTVNKTARVCSKSQDGQVYCSVETKNALQTNTTNFSYTPKEAMMKGIGKEYLYIVNKRTKNYQKKISPLKQRTSNTQLGNPSNTFGQNQRQDQIQASQNYQYKGRFNEDENMLLDPINGTETYRSAGGGAEGINSSRSISIGNMSINENASALDDSFEDKFISNILKNSELKDDKTIIKNVANNDRYNLVERPRFLLQFDFKDQESVFIMSILTQYFNFEIFQFTAKFLIDLVLVMVYIYSLIEDNYVYVYISVSVLFLLMYLGWLYSVRHVSPPNTIILFILQLIGVCVTVILFLLDGPKFNDLLDWNSQIVTNSLCMIVILFTRVIAFRNYIILQVILFTCVIVQNYFYLEKQQKAMEVYAVEVAAYLIFSSILIMAQHGREMRSRKNYNQERIIDVEIQKTEELLGKLVPLHILQGFKNDQTVVDSLENVTLLYTDMVGFTEFSKNSSAQDVVSLLSRLFSKFDQLCDVWGVYKVHTIGDCYVIMSYTGKEPKERRTHSTQIDEAYRVIRVGLEMINIIIEERESTTVPLLKNLNMRIGIHTGKIVGGIIGTKVVRYDIFGQDVLIANKMESNGAEGRVCISESTYQLIQRNKQFAETLNFNMHTNVQIDVIGKRINAYLVDTPSGQDIISGEFSSDEDDLSKQSGMIETSSEEFSDSDSNISREDDDEENNQDNVSPGQKEQHIEITDF